MAASPDFEDLRSEFALAFAPTATRELAAGQLLVPACLGLLVGIMPTTWPCCLSGRLTNLWREINQSDAPIFR